MYEVRIKSYNGYKKNSNGQYCCQELVDGLDQGIGLFPWANPLFKYTQLVQLAEERVLRELSSSAP